MKYWLFLFFAIMAEIIGTLSMKYASVNAHLFGHVVMCFMITASWIFLSAAIKRIALGVAYASWEGMGIGLITLCSVLIFDEPFSLNKFLGLSVLIAGIFLIKSGSHTQKRAGGDNANV